MIYRLAFFIIGIIFFVISLACIVGICVDKDHEPTWIYGIMFPLFVGGMLFAFSFDKPIPTIENIKEGRAEYQEIYYITGNDTVKEYKLIWKEDAFKKK